MAKVRLYEISFNGFEVPLEHERTIKELTSMKNVKSVPVNYYLVKTYDQNEGVVKFKAVLVLNKTHEFSKNIDKIEDLLKKAGIDYTIATEDKTTFIVLDVGRSNKLVRFIKRVEDKVKEFEKISTDKEFYVGFARDDIFIDRSDHAPIKVKKIELKPTDDIIVFALNYLPMPSVWFKVVEKAIVVGDYDEVSFRFSRFVKPRDMIEANRIYLSYGIPKDEGDLTKILEMKMDAIVEEVKKYDEELAGMTLSWMERLVKRHTPQLKAEVMDTISRILDEKRLKVVSTRELATKFYIEVITPDGRFYSDDIIPPFVVKKLIKTYYDNLLFKLIRAYIEEVKELKDTYTDITEEMTEEDKKSFMDKLFSSFKKKDGKEEKEVPIEATPQKIPDNEVDMFLDEVKEQIEEEE